MRAVIRLIDRIERKILGVYEFSDDPRCILRVQLCPAAHTVCIGKVWIVKGSPVLALHLWNEHLPKLPVDGANLEWALCLKRWLIFSFNELARSIQSDQRRSGIQGIRGTSALFSFTGHTGGLKMMQHLGFSILPHHNPLGKFSEFWENLYFMGLMWTYNQTSLSNHRFWHLQRTEAWISLNDFFMRYGEKKGN